MASTMNPIFVLAFGALVGMLSGFMVGLEMQAKRVDELEREIAELRAQRCPMCGETDPSKNEVNCPAKWHKQ